MARPLPELQKRAAERVDRVLSHQGDIQHHLCHLRCAVRELLRRVYAPSADAAGETHHEPGATDDGDVSVRVAVRHHRRFAELLADRAAEDSAGIQYEFATHNVAADARCVLRFRWHSCESMGMWSLGSVWLDG